MAVGIATQERARRGRHALLRRLPVRGRRRIVYLAAINLCIFSACFFLAELGFRLVWSPKYWIHADAWLIGSGQTAAGRKWWPNTTYHVGSSEFHATFRTNALGYRARPASTPAGRCFRIAFVGDSFTEGMQVEYESTFCALIESQWNRDRAPLPVICENIGVSATDLFDYWHRIVHDVTSGNPADALVLCIFPGNDFQGALPDSAFDAEDRPLRDYFTNPTWDQHVIAWVNLHSSFGSYLQRVFFSVRTRAPRMSSQGPKNWWCDPAVAARASDDVAVRRSRSLFRAIDEECRRAGTKLCVLVVGPAGNYAAKDGQSPLTQILQSWGLDAPVIDVAIRARARADHRSFTFPIDGHLNEAGHAYVADHAAPALKAALGPAIVSAAAVSCDR
jgi:hypothetical protein